MAPPDEPAKPENPTKKSERPGGPASLIGTILSGRYRIDRLLGEGGMGAVYEAEHTHMRKRLAVKVLHAEMGRLTEVVARFEREAMAAAHIDHPNVAAATDFGKLDDGSFFLVLEFVEGHTLREVIGKGALELGSALHITAQIASALHRAHALGIVHRDLKPENVMLVERDGDPFFVKVLDFGIAKVPVGELGSAKEKAGPGQPVLTQLGMIYGTPEYMAPEQALGLEVDPRADLYALGVMAYEMMTGARPFDHESKVTLLGMHVTAPVPKMSDRAPEASIPPEVEAIIVKLLAKEANDRFSEARELGDALTEVSAQLAAVGRIAAPTTGPTSLPGPLSGPRPSGVKLQLLGVDSSSYPSLGGALPVASHVASSARPPTRVLLMAGGAVLVLILVIVIAVIASGSKHGDAVASTTPSGSAGSSDAAPTTDPSASATPIGVEAEISLARTNVEKGNFADAISLLAPVAAQYPKAADLHRVLERAYAGTKAPELAMTEAALVVTDDPQASADLKLLEDIRMVALFDRDGSDVAFSLLETKLGPAGPDILYDVGYLTSGQNYPSAAKRARQSLEKPDVRAIGSDALRVALDFRDAKGCDAKHALLGQARDQGDARMLPLLKPFQATMGCGFLRRRDCAPCMHHDHDLGEAISAVEQRSPGK
jgi:eukaryotic-like serine/threonine-protein kinase